MNYLNDEYLKEEEVQVPKHARRKVDAPRVSSQLYDTLRRLDEGSTVMEDGLPVISLRVCLSVDNAFTFFYFLFVFFFFFLIWCSLRL
jgi:hypothetical protein